MTSDFQIVALGQDQFVHLFALSDEELAEQGARRMTVDKRPGYPCRVSLMDAEIGESVILVPFKHHDVESPYRSSGPIFVRQAAQTARPDLNEIPLMLHHRLLSVRAYDEDGLMRGAKVVEGQALEETIRQYLDDQAIAYLHLHNAGPGCFNCAVRRA
ncbi:MAG TPA: DUF1203 domain-containing protein [Blastocatellia bacterium]|nr:DUF1203 domain-containing protein [Blastocatellia bacterium]